jgi:hypothetical protein
VIQAKAYPLENSVYAANFVDIQVYSFWLSLYLLLMSSLIAQPLLIDGWKHPGIRRLWVQLKHFFEFLAAQNAKDLLVVVVINVHGLNTFVAVVILSSSNNILNLMVPAWKMFARF